MHQPHDRDAEADYWMNWRLFATPPGQAKKSTALKPEGNVEPKFRMEESHVHSMIQLRSVSRYGSSSIVLQGCRLRLEYPRSPSRPLHRAVHVPSPSPSSLVRPLTGSARCGRARRQTNNRLQARQLSTAQDRPTPERWLLPVEESNVGLLSYCERRVQAYEQARQEVIGDVSPDWSVLNDDYSDRDLARCRAAERTSTGAQGWLCIAGSLGIVPQSTQGTHIVIFFLPKRSHESLRLSPTLGHTSLIPTKHYGPCSHPKSRRLKPNSVF